jgi:hypothetical protein
MNLFASKTTLTPTPSGRDPVSGALYLDLFEQPVKKEYFRIPVKNKSIRVPLFPYHQRSDAESFTD